MVTGRETVIAEHREALKTGQSIVDKEHLAELWKLIDEQTKEPTRPSWELTFKQAVEQVPLARFEGVTA